MKAGDRVMNYEIRHFDMPLFHFSAAEESNDPGIKIK